MPARMTATKGTATSAGVKSAMRQTARPSVSKGIDFNEDQVDEILNDEDEQEGDENGMLEMLSMLQELQKRKASKSSTRSVAFQTKKSALFTDVRATVDTIVRDGAAYIDQCKTRLVELKAQEVSQEKNLQSLSALRKNQEDTVRNLLKTYPTLIEDLSHRRSAQINEASALLEGHAQERQESRKRLIQLAKARADEILERQKLATDASALIKHYKALLLA
ncbi:uncharacterized protein B0H18DRAFT_134323 [Fomitopsis serialis]|uniref:uncharacterized protein n=1 Tax=Fomitopsis serialis TaxID=139415 RepID=UPI0020087798|nr:uncharacterized protein B0H18DRAFT_134323 [Neoantrodia serialis]KAH9930749.1 hypothetical protein B0H18DRAFT_134323 [Neoantrodia serialis]